MTILNHDQCQHLIDCDDELSCLLTAAQSLDFSLLKTKIMEEQGWTPEYTDEVEGLYHRFLALTCYYEDEVVCPTGPIDTFWHAHILDTIRRRNHVQPLIGKVKIFYRDAC